MGQEILYCFKCQERITSADLESSKALRFGARTACKKCVPDLLAGLSDHERQELVSRVQSGPEQRSSSTRTPLPTSTPRPRVIPAVPRSPGSGSGVIWASVGGVMALFLVLAVVLRNSGAAAPVRESRETGVTPPTKSTESGRDRAAHEALEKAKRLPASDLDGQIVAYADAARLAEGTSYEREAKERHEGVLDMRRKAYAREIAAADEKARAHLQKEEFGAALAVVDALRPLHAASEWKSQVEEKVEQVRKSADAVFVALKESAELARRKGAEEEVKAIRERIARWGLPGKGAELDGHLATIVSAAPPRPWTPLFDGKTTTFLISNGEGAWSVENGQIVHVKGRKQAAQTRQQFGDGELRIVFEFSQAEHVGFSIRQGLGYHSLSMLRPELDQKAGQEHELLFLLRGKEVLATMDGKPQKVDVQGSPPLQGPLQFNSIGERFVVKSVEFRELELNDSLVGHWTFDATAGGKALDSSPARNDASLFGGPADVPGKLGGALEFNGRSTYVSCPSSASLDLTGPFTISAWVKTAKADKMAQGLVEKWDPSGKEGKVGYYMRLVQGRLELTFPTPEREMECRGNKTIPVDQWTLLTGVYDGGTILIYVDGVLDRKNAVAQSPRVSKNPLVIGAGGGSDGNHFTGALDDVRIWSRALSVDEITRLAQGR